MSNSNSSKTARPAPLSFTPIHANAGSSNNANDDSVPPSPTSQPVTPHSLSFLTPPLPGTPPHSVPNPFSPTHTPNTSTSGNANGVQNPFSPPASVRSFSSPGDTPGYTPLSRESTSGYPFPSANLGSPGSTRNSSLVDVPRAFSTYSVGGRGSMSRPSTGASLHPGSIAEVGLLSNAANGGAGNGANGANAGTVPATPSKKRDTFASPPSRPLTLYSSAHSPFASALPLGTTSSTMPTRRKSTAILVPSRTVLPPGEPRPSVKEVEEMKKRRPELKVKLVKPWVDDKDSGKKKEKDGKAGWAYWITYAMVLVGVAVGAVRVYLGWKGVWMLEGPLCPVLIEDFTNTTTDQLFGTGVAGEGGTFFREVDASGFGNGEFEMTTASDSNSFVYNNQLYLVPTLTSDVIPEGSILDGAVYNLTDCTYNITHSTGYTTEGHGAAGINSTAGTSSDGTTGIAPDTPLDLAAYLAACSAVSNATTGKILPPVMSARISTRKSASVKFGRVEVRAKLPTGDWLWPAIWMLPVDNAYGAWPLSGEIDIMEARGNGPSYPKQGINYVRSSLNWGPATFLNAVAKTYGWYTERRGRFDDGFHTYSLEWDEDYIRMYVDSRLQGTYQTAVKKSFWDRGAFPPVVQNGTASVELGNPWVNGTKAAPFDQSFYLILNVAVGGTNGWFPDGPEKPWLDGSATAPLDFLRAQNQWYPTWGNSAFKRGMVVDSVKMWEKCPSS